MIEAGERPVLKMKDWCSYAEAAEMLGLSIGSVRVYAQRGVLVRKYIFGEVPAISKESIADYEKMRKPAGNPGYAKVEDDDEDEGQRRASKKKVRHKTRKKGTKACKSKATRKKSSRR